MELLRESDSKYPALDFLHYNYTASNGPLLFEEHLTLGVVLIATGLIFGIWQLIAVVTYLNYPTVLWRASVLPEALLMLTDLAVSALHPFSGVSAILNRWIWGPYGCQAFAFSALLLNTLQLLLVPFVALVRCMEAGTKGYTKRRTKCYWVVLILLFLFALCWALAPIFGIARYNQTPVLVTCAIDWTHNDFVYMVYVLSQLGATVALPLLIGLVAYIVLFVKVRRDGIRLEWAPEGKEGRVMVGRLISVYLGWIAYIVLAVWAIIDEDPKANIPQWLYILPPVLVKAVGLLHLVFYFWLNPKLIACLRKLCGRSFDRSLVYDVGEVAGYQVAGYKASGEDGTKEEARNLTGSSTSGAAAKLEIRAPDSGRGHHAHAEVGFADE